MDIINLHIIVDICNFLKQALWVAYSFWKKQVISRREATYLFQIRNGKHTLLIISKISVAETQTSHPEAAYYVRLINDFSRMYRKEPAQKRGLQQDFIRRKVIHISGT